MEIVTRSYYPINWPFAMDRPADYELMLLIPVSAWAVRGTIGVPANRVWIIRVATLKTLRTPTANQIELGTTVQRAGGPEIMIAYDAQVLTGAASYWVFTYPVIRLNAGDAVRFYARNSSAAARDLGWQLLIDEIDP